MKRNSVSASRNEEGIKVLSFSTHPFQDQYLQNLTRDETDYIEDEFCLLDSPETSQKSVVQILVSKSSQIKVTEKSRNSTSNLSQADDKNLQVKGTINQNTIHGITSIQGVSNNELPQEGSNVSEKGKELENFGSKQKIQKMDRTLKTEKIKTIIERKVQESATPEPIGKYSEVVDGIKEDKITNKCDWCKRGFDKNDLGKIAQHKKLSHNLSCSSCYLMFVDEMDLREHARKSHRSGMKHHAKEMDHENSTHEAVLKRHVDEGVSEGDSNKDCDDIKLIAFVPKIIKGATNKKYFKIKKEQDMNVVKVNETKMNGDITIGDSATLRMNQPIKRGRGGLKKRGPRVKTRGVKPQKSRATGTGSLGPPAGRGLARRTQPWSPVPPTKPPKSKAKSLKNKNDEVVELSDDMEIEVIDLSDAESSPTQLQLDLRTAASL